MPTGYEVQMYRDLERSRQAMEKLVKLQAEQNALVERVAVALEFKIFGRMPEDAES